MPLITPPPEIRKVEIRKLSRKEVFVRLAITLVVIAEVVVLALLA